MSTARSLLVATSNLRKRDEIFAILESYNLNLELKTLSDYPTAQDVEETGSTFAENAALKARAGLAVSGELTLADDGGLIVDALEGKPGVHSHRFLGAGVDFETKMREILRLMEHVPDRLRSCRFECAVAIAVPDGQLLECSGVCNGKVARELRGSYGFGYDPLFYLPELGKHMAELSPEEKNRVSHRGRALACAAQALRSLFG
ncbi:MAG TPA: RdgB/HAM1 family non-canonical purine NTP pyrophosphatase [Chthonomonadales bacterium]|nr:RdgB/HAM1 family non-canonical purine NTP pyrophosphatase [Chthonomonadales bacterium]